MEQSDEYLVERSRTGDEMAFKALVIRHEGKVAGVVHSMLGATPEAEDVDKKCLFGFTRRWTSSKGSRW